MVVVAAEIREQGLIRLQRERAGVQILGATDLRHRLAHAPGRREKTAVGEVRVRVARPEIEGPSELALRGGPVPLVVRADVGE